MSNNWFDNHVYEIVVDNSLLTPEHRKIISEGKVENLPLWDPLASLAI